MSSVILLVVYPLVLFLFRVPSFYESGTDTNHEETIGSCCQPFFMFSIVESCNKAEDLSLAQRQPEVSRAYIIQYVRARGLHGS